MAKRHRRALAVPAFIQRGIFRIERERRANGIAQPMRELFATLAQGEVLEVNGQPAMHWPECDASVPKQAEFCAIAPAILGWIDCWNHLAPDMDTYHMRVLAERLSADKPITPRLVDLARAEFEATIARIPELPPGAIESALTTTRIQWEFERMELTSA